MSEIVKIIATALVDNPDQIDIQTEESGDEVVINLRVADEDMGKIIGKRGRIAKAIRTVLKSAGIRTNKFITLKIMENVIED